MSRKRSRSWTPGGLAPQILMAILVFGGATLRNLGVESAWLSAIFPELQGLCPIGAAQSAARLVVDPGFLINPSHGHVWVLLGGIVTAALVGAVFCGRLCVFGAVQEWIGRLGRRVLGKRYNSVTRRYARADRALGYLRFVMLAVVAASVGGLIAVELDALNVSSALTHVWTAAVPISAVVLLGLVLALSFFVERPWCRWVCPYGAIQGTVARLSPWTIRRSADACISCRKCDRACGMNVDVSGVAAVRDSRCNRCGRCVAACPVQGALSFSARRGRLRLRPALAISAVAAVLFAAPLVTARCAGWYVPRGVAASAAAPASFSVDGITPDMSLAELAEASRIARGDLCEALGLPPGYDPETRLLGIEDDPDHENVTMGFIRSAVDALLHESFTGTGPAPHEAALGSDRQDQG